MKLNFKKNLTDTDKLKFLLCLCKNISYSKEEINFQYHSLLKKGYLEDYNYTPQEWKILKALNIWEEKKIIGKFWDDDENEYAVGIFGGKVSENEDDFNYKLTDSSGGTFDCYQNFKQITSLEELE